MPILLLVTKNILIDAIIITAVEIPEDLLFETVELNKFILQSSPDIEIKLTFDESISKNNSSPNK